MKHLTWVIVALAVAFGERATAQSASSTWSLDTATTVTAATLGNVTGRNESFGDMTINNYAGPNGSQRVTTIGGSWPAESNQNDTRYVQFAVKPNAGYDFDITSISLSLGASGGSNMRAKIWYSTDSTFASRTKLDSLALPNGSLLPLSYSPTALVPDGQTFYLRIYPWYTTSSTGKYLCPQNVIISGTTLGALGSITVSDTVLPSFGAVLTGTTSPSQSYTVSGMNLLTDIVITAPAGFKLSTDNSTFVGSLNLTPAGGTVPLTAIYVHFVASSANGTVSGNVSHTSTATTTRNIGVSAIAVAVEPTTASTISFGAVTGYTITANFSGGNGTKRILVARANGPVVWNPTDGIPVAGVDSVFSAATDQGSGNKVVYDGTGTTVTVSGLTQATSYHFAVYEYNVGTNNSQNYLTSSFGTGSQATNAVPTIVVAPTTLAFGNVGVNTTSAEKTYILSGSTLTPAGGNITVTAPTAFEVSLASGSGFGPSVIVPYAGGTLPATTIYTRFHPTSITQYNDNITNAGGGAPTQNVAVSGNGQGPSEPNVLQAEDGILTSAYVRADYTGYTGSGFVDIADKTGAALEVDFRRATAATDTVRVYFANGGSSRAYSVSLNGATIGPLTFGSTGSWTSWSSVMMMVPLQAGVNRLKFSSTTNGGNANIDKVYIGGQTATPVYKLTLAKSGSGIVSAVPASADSFYDAGTSVTLTATPSGGSSFYRWSGTDQSSLNPYTMTVNSHRTEIGVMPANPGFGAFPYESAPKGFASVGAFTYPNGTTGGSGPGSQTVYVTNSDELGNLMLRRVDANHTLNFPPLIVYVIGTLTTGTVVTGMCDVKDVYDISIIGVGVDATLSGFGLNVVRSKNIIIRNLKIQNSPIDGITVQANDIDGTGNHLWFDHNTITNCYDGALDVTHTASYVTVSWNHFYNHNKLCLMGHSNTQTSDVTMKVSYHHNYFDSTVQRHPRVRFGKAHVYNNYYRKIGLYGVSSNLEADVLLEGNHFQNVPLPSDTSRDGSPPGDVVERNNIYVSSGAPQTRGTAFEASTYYGYSVDDPAGIPALVSAYAGSGKWDFSSGGSSTPTPPGIPTLVAPTNGSTGIPLTQTLVWKTNLNTTSYRIQLALDSTFASSILIDSTLTDTSCVASGLLNLTTYYWRVRGINGVGPGSFSPSWKFQTVPLATAVISVSPATLSFGNTIVNSVVYDTVKVKSVGLLTLHVDSIRATGGEFGAAPTSPIILPAGDSLQVSVTFNPTTVGSQMGRLVVYSDAPSSPDTVALTGTGTGVFSVNVPLAVGWNIVSNPVVASNDSVLRVFPSASLPYAFAFTPGSGYQQHYRLENGRGYWEKFPRDTSAMIFGDAITTDTIAVVSGWNMVGSIAFPVDTSTIVSIPSDLRASVYFRYQGGYIAAGTIQPGRGYWVKASTNGIFILNSTGSHAPAALSASGGVEAFNAITITDALGRGQTLYFGGKEFSSTRLEMFEMPPLGPDGIFDARFASKRLLELFDRDRTSHAIELRSAVFPLKVSWNLISAANGYTLGDGISPGRTLSPSGDLVLTNPDVRRLILGREGVEVPAVFSLEQNYPNPFNPTTTIKFTVSETAPAVLIIYNLLGQEVMRVFDATAQPGYRYVVDVDAGSLASGMYIYRLQSGARREQKRLMLLK